MHGIARYWRAGIRSSQPDAERDLVEAAQDVCGGIRELDRAGRANVDELLVRGIEVRGCDGVAYAYVH